MKRYTDLLAQQRAPLPNSTDLVDFVRFASLAASGHNTQPWLFSLGHHAVTIAPDFTRRTPVVDPQDHHLFVSLGCAAENFSIAAAANGRPCRLALERDTPTRLRMELDQGPPAQADLCDAIPKRQSTRSLYDGRPVGQADLKQLEREARMDGVSVVFITDAQRCNTVTDYVVAGNREQLGNKEFVQELKESIRFNRTDAMTTGDGLFSGCTGNPNIPTWIGRGLFNLLVTENTENTKIQRQMKSSAGVAIFVGDRQDEDHWIRVGRAYERFALMATVLGIRTAHLNQPVEVPAVRQALADWLNLEDRLPDLVVRFGYAPAMPMSLRRPVAAIITNPPEHRA